MSDDDSGATFQAAVMRAMEASGGSLDQAVGDVLAEMRAGGFASNRPVESGRTEISNVDGVDWYEAPIPGRFHRCKRQTWGYVDWFTFIERCACGSTRRDNAGQWFNRNSRKRPAARKEAS